MKPICVTMQAFGCYQCNVTVDFTKLGSHPIFLITGSTGGGKTTILDAMCFALYCKATGGRRSWSSMRSTSASDDLPTQVEFTFQLSNETYKFYRSQSIHFVRGSGERKIREEHSCYQLVDDEWQLMLSGSETKVRDCAQELLGLTCEQFSQVIVLPQGDFLKLLRANSVNKAEILQTLFSTEIWSDITKNFKVMSDELKQKTAELHSVCDSILAREEVQDIESLEEKQKSIFEELKKSENDLQSLQKKWKETQDAFSAATELDRQYKIKNQFEQTLQLLTQQTEMMEQNRNSLKQGRLVQQIIPYYQAAHAAKEERHKKFLMKQSAEQAHAQAMANHVNAQKDAEKVAPLREKSLSLAQSIGKLETALANAVRLESSEKDFQNKRNEIKKQNEIIASAKIKLKTAEENVAKGNEYLKQAQLYIQKMPEYITEAQNIRQEYDAICNLEKIKAELNQAKSIFDVTSSEEQKSDIKLKALRTQLAQEEEAMHSDLSGTLAAELKDGMPCPVCGSVHHPAPACQNAKGYSKEKIDLLRKSVEEETASFEKVSKIRNEQQAKYELQFKEFTLQQDVCSKIAYSQQELETLLKTYNEKLEQCKIYSNKIKEAESKLERRKAEQMEAQQQLEKEKEQLSTLEREAEGLSATAAEIKKALDGKTTVSEIEAELNLLRKEQVQCNQQALQFENQLSEAKSAVAATEADEKSAKTAYEEALRNLEHAEKAFTDATLKANLSADLDYPSLLLTDEQLLKLEQTIQTYDSKLLSVRQQLSQLKEELKNQQLPNIDVLEKEKNDLQLQNDQLSQKIGRLEQNHESAKKSLNQLKKSTKSCADVENKFSRANRIALLLSGKNPYKIPLQQFVLGIMLDDILSSANQFFSQLSHGRYNLLRVTGAVGGNALSGLDLQVLDAFSGSTRSIETLSGGEQFLASLSLAFGLSDVVQGYSGCVHLDSIFIDEGFGSLDQETLDTAMKALLQIQQMGRTIGIISHVTELKTRISAQIEVVKSGNGGSTIKIKAE